MFSYRVALGSVVVVALASGFEAQVSMDAADAMAQGLTLEPVEHCPETAAKSFHHDGLQKDQRAHATYKFDPPQDGCYLIEEKHPQLEQCKASSNTKMHVNYDKGLHITGTVDQTANGGQWTFIATLPFYAGHTGAVTLSNEGTQDGTLTTFNQVRFTWSGKSCNSDSHPREAQIRITLPFKLVANHLPEFGSALKSKLAYWAEVPEKSLYLTDLRSGSIIAELLVMPSAADGFSPEQIIERLRGAVAKHTSDLCAVPMVIQTLFGDATAEENQSLAQYYLEGCNVEIKDLGLAKSQLMPVTMQEQQYKMEDEDTAVTMQEQQYKMEDEDTAEGMDAVIIYVAACIAALGLMGAVAGLCIYRSRKSNKRVSASLTNDKYAWSSPVQDEKKEFAAVVVDSKPVLPLAEKPKKPVDDENTSTAPPSEDTQSEASASALGTVKALSNQDL